MIYCILLQHDLVIEKYCIILTFLKNYINNFSKVTNFRKVIIKYKFVQNEILPTTFIKCIRFKCKLTK